MRQAITSATNPLIKLVVKLRERKYRRRENLFVAEGSRLVQTAWQAGSDVEFVIVDGETTDERILGLTDEMEERGQRVYVVPSALYKKISDTQTPQGIMTVLRRHTTALEDVSFADASPLLAVIDGAADPGNVGTVIRSADAFGANAVIFLKDSADPFAPKTVRATMGSLFHLPVVEGVSAAEFTAYCRAKGIACLAGVPKETGKACYLEDMTKPLAIVVGNEARGVSREIFDAAQKVFIPMCGEAESLNAASAATVLLYEAMRQRRVCL